MIICGLDLSPRSTGITKYVLDDNLNVIDKTFHGFAENKKKTVNHDNIVLFDKFDTDYDRMDFMSKHVIDFCRGCDYVAIESYAFGAKGDITQIAEFSGIVKLGIYNNNTKIRFYDPLTIKYSASENWRASKFDMFNAYNDSTSINKHDISILPVVTEKKLQGVSPTSDIIDSWFIAELLLVELKLRKGLVDLKSLPEKHILIMNRVTKANPTNILATEFLQKRS